MKKIFVIVNIALLIAVAVLYILFFTSKNSKPQTASVLEFASSDSTKYLPIAYIDVDSLLLKYEFAKEEHDKLLTKQESSRLTLAQKTDDFQKDYVDFQKKLENNVFTTRERAEQESQRLAKKQDNLRTLEARLTDELYAQQQKINQQLKDSLSLVLKSYSNEKGLHLIFSNTMNDNILYSSSDIYNITNDIAEILNSRYVKKK